MRLNCNSTGRLVLQPIDDVLVIADSQLDYPGTADGWQFLAMTTDGTTAPLSPRTTDPASPTHNSFGIGKDPYCHLGRDHCHPGYNENPALVWIAPRDCVVDLSCEVAVRNPNTRGQAMVRVMLDQVQLVRHTHQFPVVCRFRHRIRCKKNSRLAVVFEAERIIDHLISLYYCWLVDVRDGGPLDGEPLVESVVQIDENPSWSTRVNDIAGVVFAEDEVSIRQGQSPGPKIQPFVQDLELFAEQHRRRLHKGRILGQPRFFGIPRDQQ